MALSECSAKFVIGGVNATTAAFEAVVVAIADLVNIDSGLDKASSDVDVVLLLLLLLCMCTVRLLLMGKFVCIVLIDEARDEVENALIVLLSNDANINVMMTIAAAADHDDLLCLAIVMCII